MKDPKNHVEHPNMMMDLVPIFMRYNAKYSIQYS